MGPPRFHTPSVQHISSTQKGHSFLAPKAPRLNSENPSVPHTPQFHTKNPSVPHQKPSVPHQKPLSSPPSVPHQKLLSSALKTPQFNTPLRQKLC